MAQGCGEPQDAREPPKSEISAGMQDVGRAAPSSDVPGDGERVSRFRSKRMKPPSCQAEHSQLHPAPSARLLLFGSSCDILAVKAPK